MQLDVIIPVKDRPDLDRCLRSLLPSQLVQRVIICDGGSVTIDCINILQVIQQEKKVDLLQLQQQQFNKAQLLNHGILATQADYLLLSDADIIWNETTLKTLVETVAEQDDRLVSVGVVQESNPHTVALQRDRYAYKITTTPPNTIDIDLVPLNPGEATIRPGCGLLCARRSTLLKLGGYQTCFQGWGWEDQDLLIRAELMGFEVQAAGQVIHLSHSDAQRNQDFQGTSPTESRDRNIRTCFQRLSTGNLWGDIPSNFQPAGLTHTIQTRLPQSLNLS